MLTKFLEDNEIMRKNQIGFKKHSRTSDHLFVIKTIMDKLKSKKCKEIYACFIDFKYNLAQRIIVQVIKFKNFRIFLSYYQKHVSERLILCQM